MDNLTSADVCFRVFRGRAAAELCQIFLQPCLCSELFECEMTQIPVPGGSYPPSVCPSLFQVVAQAVLFMCMNTAGIFISYLSDRAQRQAFLETRRCIEARLRLETENQRQVSPQQDTRWRREMTCSACFII